MLPFPANQMRYPITTFPLLVSPGSLFCPTTILFGGFADASGTFFCFCTSRSQISENPFDQRYQRSGFGLPITVVFVRLQTLPVHSSQPPFTQRKSVSSVLSAIRFWSAHHSRLRPIADASGTFFAAAVHAA